MTSETKLKGCIGQSTLSMQYLLCCLVAAYFFIPWFSPWFGMNLYVLWNTYSYSWNIVKLTWTYSSYTNAGNESRNALYMALWHTWKAMPSVQVATSSWLLIHLVLAIELLSLELSFINTKKIIKQNKIERERESTTGPRQVLHRLKVLPLRGASDLIVW